jgi:hypothetical protein
MQNYLRNQHDNTKSHNLVKAVCELTTEFSKQISDDFQLASQLFRTLTDFASGCPENQVAMMESLITFPVNKIFESNPECNPTVLKVKVPLQRTMPHFSLTYTISTTERHFGTPVGTGGGPVS